MTNWLGLPPDASAHGIQIDHLIGSIHVLMLVLLIGWGGFFLYTIVRFRQSKQPVANFAAGRRSRMVIYLALVVAAIEVYDLVGVSIPTWAKVITNIPDSKDAVVLHVVAEQFLWNVHYPGPDGQFGRRDIKLLDSENNPLGLDRTDLAAQDDITTINQLHLPVNKPVIIYLSSKDVIHCFSLPVMRVKQDVIPGMSIPVTFTPTVIGNYEIACAQLCGLGHYRMRGYLVIQSQADYDAWLAQQTAEQHPAS